MKRLLLIVAGLALLGASPVAAAADEPTVNITSADQSDTELGVDAPAGLTTIYDSPYESVTINTTIVDNSSERDVREPVVRALEYWENNSLEYVGYPVNYTLVDDNPDLKIELVDDVSVCGTETGQYYGCADVIKNQTYGVVDARVEATLSSPGVYDTTVHEIGHTLGLEHDDEPAIMNGTLPSAWERSPTMVHIGDGVAEQDDVLAGLNYVSDTVDAVSGDFQTVSNRTDAGIAIKTVEDGACGEAYVSCTSSNQTLSDQLVISVEDSLDDSAVPWHVSYFVASFGERPPPLEPSAGYDKRRSEWWE